MSSDIKLLGYVAATLFFFMAIMLLLTMRQAGRIRGATLWLWSTLIAAIAIVLNTAQEVIPEFFGYVVSGVLLIVGPLMSARGTFEYRYHRRFPVHWIYAAVALATPAFYYFTFIVPSIGVRVLMVAVPIAMICSWHAWVMLAGSGLRPRSAGVQHARFRISHGIMVLGLLMVAFVFFIRALDTIQVMSAGPAVIPRGGSPRTAFFFYSVGLVGRLFLLIGMVLVLMDELEQELRTLASRDALTGLFNRRGLNAAAGASAITNASLLMLDLDHFKAVNDDFGHDQGDRVIGLLARCAQANLPANAVLARLGGEEFCALLPQSDLAAAQTCAETLRKAFNLETAALGHSRQHTVSIGVAAAGTAQASLRDLMDRADQALYRAKHGGRNRIESAEA
ncbi:MAG: GGDEF domain-containing protein [Casimicrobium sp.]|jgi:diguanylate cyclase (GGDEF)-like protein